VPRDRRLDQQGLLLNASDRTTFAQPLSQARQRSVRRGNTVESSAFQGRRPSRRGLRPPCLCKFATAQSRTRLSRRSSCGWRSISVGIGMAAARPMVERHWVVALPAGGEAEASFRRIEAAEIDAWDEAQKPTPVVVVLYSCFARNSSSPWRRRPRCSQGTMSIISQGSGLSTATDTKRVSWPDHRSALQLATSRAADPSERSGVAA
jgi:hypothetical protein